MAQSPASLLKVRAEQYFSKGLLRDATNSFEAAAKAILGSSHSFPARGPNMRNEAYAALNVFEKLEVLECLNGLARCMIKDHDLHKVRFPP